MPSSHFNLTFVAMGTGTNPLVHHVLRLHPLYKVLLSLVLALLSYVVVPKSTLSPLMALMGAWIVFSLCYVTITWIVLFNRPIEEIKSTARRDDGSKTFVFVMVLVSSFASMLTVLLMMVSKDVNIHRHPLFLPLTISGMLLSWVMVHTIFTIHYAHIYYDDDTKKGIPVAGGLEFPGKEDPNYLDFAYFAFVVGCTFQVSDVQVTSKKIRRLVLVHGLISFALNTFVVALTINIMAGINK